MIEIAGVPLVRGIASGRALRADEPLSLWGGLNPDTGEIIDRRHPLSGEVVTGRVLVLPHGRGSCSASGVLLEAIRNGVAPAAVIVSRVDPIIGLGAILGDELYGLAPPVILVREADRVTIQSGDWIEHRLDGRLVVNP